MTEFTAVEEFLFWLRQAFTVAVIFYAFKFVFHYRKVDWRGSLWGEHIMRFSAMIGVVFLYVLAASVLAYFDWSSRPVQYVLTLGIFGWFAWEMRRQTRLERLAQQRARETRATARPYRRHSEDADA